MSSQPLASNLWGQEATLQIGDIVRTGDNLHPHYRVIAVNDDRAWVRDIQYRTDHIVAIERCSRIA